MTKLTWKDSNWQKPEPLSFIVALDKKTKIINTHQHEAKLYNNTQLLHNFTKQYKSYTQLLHNFTFVKTLQHSTTLYNAFTKL
jgi:hypothetical protein